MTSSAGGRPPADSAWIRRVACVSTTRADAGIYRPLLQALAANAQWRVFCLAGGTHFSEEFGATITDLARQEHGVEVVPVEHFVPGDGEMEVAASAGKAVDAYSWAYAEQEIDLVFLLGDRPEMLAAGLAATIHRIPIAHLHGGDITAGAYDDACRHAITKLSHLHLPALVEHAARIAAMGEEPWRIHSVGALALDELTSFKPDPESALAALLEMELRRPVIVVAYHPETLSAMPPEQQAEALVAALQGIDASFIVIGTNADVGHDAVRETLTDFVESAESAVYVPSLPQRTFWSCLARADALVGNTSAGILESPSLRLPVVNIGDRQEGRVRAANVIDVPTEYAAIREGIQEAMSAAFRSRLAELVNPYGGGGTAARIVEILQNLPERNIMLRKMWNDKPADQSNVCNEHAERK